MKNNMRKEQGAIMVEAAIYMPLVLCTVMALLYLAVFNMQEYMLMYQVEKIASVAAREEAYPGYEEFNMGGSNAVDFSWGEQEIPSQEKVSAYYEAHHGDIRALYREIGGVLSAVGAVHHDGQSYGSRFAGAVRQSSLIALGSISVPEVNIDNGFFGTGITVTITHATPVPGVLKYLGYQGSTTVRAAAYSYSVNPSEFVRNVDLAADLTSYIMEKLGISGGYKEFLSKTDKVLSQII